MKSSPARIAAVTAALLVAGGVFGAVAAGIGAAVAVTVTELELPPMEVVAFAMVVGGSLGAPLLPATSWLLLRRVPLGVSWLGTTVGTVLGGVLGWVAGFVTSADPVGWAIMAALAGFFASVIFLRVRFSAPRERVRVPGGAGA